MPLLEPVDLFRHAQALLEQPSQADLRRAISAAYYGVFHAIARAGADMVVGEAARGTERYDWVYRSVDHTKLRDLCKSDKWRGALPGFAEAVVQLQQAREDADYSALLAATPSDAVGKIATAQNAVALFGATLPDTRLEFLTALLFKPRRRA